MKKSASKLTIKELARLGVMTTLLIVSVHALAPLPNVEPVTVLVILFTLSRGKRAGYILAAYLLLVWLRALVDHVRLHLALSCPSHLAFAQTAVCMVLEPSRQRFRSFLRSHVLHSLSLYRRALHGLYLVGGRNSLRPDPLPVQRNSLHGSFSSFEPCAGAYLNRSFSRFCQAARRRWPGGGDAFTTPASSLILWAGPCKSLLFLLSYT